MTPNRLVRAAMTQPDLEALIDAIYSAAADAGEWRSLPLRLMPVFRAAASVLYERDDFTSERPIALGAAYGYSDSEHADFQRHWRFQDLRVRSIVDAQPGFVYADDRTLPFSAIAPTALHNEFYRPAGVGHVAGVLLARGGGRLSILSLHRQLRYGDFPAEEVAALDRLASHLVRAATLRHRIAAAEARAKVAMLALDHFPLPVLLVDSTLRVHDLNAVAEVRVRAGGVLRVQAGAITVARLSGQAALQNAVKATLATGKPTTLTLHDGPDAASLLVAADRRGVLRQAGMGQLAALFVDDHRIGPLPSAARLVIRFGLTPAEASVVAALVAGLDLAAIAQRHGTSVLTVRTQIKQALLKCGAHSQAQLVGRVLAGLGGLL
jgi:DNA-binding CsgD family transcriptional regulator